MWNLKIFVLKNAVLTVPCALGGPQVISWVYLALRGSHRLVGDQWVWVPGHAEGHRSSARGLLGETAQEDKGGKPGPQDSLSGSFTGLAGRDEQAWKILYKECTLISQYHRQTWLM